MTAREDGELDLYRRIDEANEQIIYLPDGSQQCVACGATSRSTKIGSDVPLRKGLLEMGHRGDCPHLAEMESRLDRVYPSFAAAKKLPPNPLPPRRWWRFAWQHPCVDGHAYAKVQQYRVGATRGYRLQCRHCGVPARPCEQDGDFPYVEDPSL